MLSSNILSDFGLSTYGFCIVSVLLKCVWLTRMFACFDQVYCINEPRHDKTNKVTVCSAKTQISLGIRPV